MLVARQTPYLHNEQSMRCRWSAPSMTVSQFKFYNREAEGKTLLCQPSKPFT